MTSHKAQLLSSICFNFSISFPWFTNGVHSCRYMLLFISSLLRGKEEFCPTVLKHIKLRRIFFWKKKKTKTSEFWLWPEEKDDREGLRN